MNGIRGLNIGIKDIIEENNFNFEKNTEGKIWITKYNDREGVEEVSIPEFVSGFKGGEKVFEGVKYLKKVIGTKPLEGSLENTFYGFRGKDLTLENFDTSQIYSMHSMFLFCESLESLVLGKKFSTSKVENMSHMFGGCANLRELRLGEKFYTSEVMNMSHMFDYCESLETLVLGEKFYTYKVMNMAHMFTGCANLSEETRKQIKEKIGIEVE